MIKKIKQWKIKSRRYQKLKGPPKEFESKVGKGTQNLK